MSQKPLWVPRLAELSELDPAPADVLREQQAREAGILLLCSGVDEFPEILLLQRAQHLRHHPGQPGFPGGAREASDRTIIDTALRETEEEVGVEPTQIEVMRTLPTRWAIPSKFQVTPVLATAQLRPSDLHPNPDEVERAELVSFADLRNPDLRVQVRKGPFTSPGFQVNDMLVWGFTGFLLDALIRGLGWEQPWDQEHVVELDAYGMLQR